MERTQHRMRESIGAVVLAISLALSMTVPAFAAQTADKKALAEEKLAALEQIYADAYAEAKELGYIDQAIEGIDAAIDELNKVEADEEAEQVIGEAIAALEQAKDLINGAEALDQAAFDELMALLEQAVVVLQSIESAGYVDEAIAAIEAAYDKLMAELGVDIEDLYDMLLEYADGLEDVIEDLEDEAVEAIEDATHGEYVVGDSSKYVAIGDMTVGNNPESETYVQLLSDYINGVAGYDVPVVNLNEDGESLLAQDILAKVESDEAWRSHIAEADLITVSVGQENLTTYVNDVIIEMLDNPDKAVECDWASVVGEEGATYVEAVLDLIKDELLEVLGNEAAAAKAIDLINAYAYGYATFTVSYAEVLDAIQAVNDDAQVVVVGLNNAFGDLATLDLSGYGVDATIEIGEYAEYVIAATDLQFLGYALAMGDEDITFVSAPDAETAVSAKDSVQPSAFLAPAADWMPNVVGHEYIYQQIIGAMDISLEVPEYLLGDVDGDGNVFPNDAMLVLQYYVGLITADGISLPAADVDGDGNVFPNDAMLILQYYVGLITDFPASAE